MKKTLLTLVLFASLTSLKAQSLANTLWADYDSTNTFNIYWNFTTDSVRFSFDLINWDVIGGYTFTPNVYKMIDDPAQGCGNPLDTGVYAASFSADTMWLTPIYDSCTERQEYIGSHYFLNIMMSIEEPTAASDFNVYPNPSDGNITVSCNEQSVPREILVTDMTGRVVHREMNTGKASMFELDLRSLPAGTYLVNCDFGDHTSTKRFVRL